MVIYGLLRDISVKFQLRQKSLSNFFVGQCNQPKPVVKSVVNLKPSR